MGGWVGGWVGGWMNGWVGGLGYRTYLGFIGTFPIPSPGLKDRGEGVALEGGELLARLPLDSCFFYCGGGHAVFCFPSLSACRIDSNVFLDGGTWGVLLCGVGGCVGQVAVGPFAGCSS